eukprot:4244839-Pleurochrysis_carterae.AAC.1
MQALLQQTLAPSVAPRASEVCFLSRAWREKRACSPSRMTVCAALPPPPMRKSNWVANAVERFHPNPIDPSDGTSLCVRP